MRWWLTVLILAGTAFAGPYEDAIRAHRGGDKATLKRLAESTRSWKLACLLCARGEHAAAAALAGASDMTDVAKLSEQVARWRKQPATEDAVKRADAIDDACRRQAWPHVLPLTKTPASDPFLEAHRLAQRGNALAHLGKTACLEILADAERRCDAIGWYHGQWIALHNTAWFYAVSQRFREALAAFKRELAQRERRGVSIAGAASNLGASYGYIGAYRQALVYFERAAAELEGPAKARALNNAALAHSYLGDYAKAYGLYEKALGLADEMQAIVALTGLSGVEIGLGNLEKAEQLSLEALRRARDTNNKPLVTRCEGDLGNVYEERGNWKGALERYERVHRSAREFKDTRSERIAAGNIGVVHLKAGDVAKARDVLTAAIPPLEELGHVSMAMRCTVRLGEAEAKLGNNDEALAHFRTAIAKAREQDEGVIELLALEAMARAQLDHGDAPGAVATARAAGDTLWQLVRGLSDEQGAGARAKHADLFAIGIRAAARQGDAATLAEFIERGRAGALLESLQAREDIRAALVPDELRDAQDEATTDVALARRKYLAAIRARKRKAIRAAKKELDAARTKVREVQGRIQRALKAGSALVYPEPLPLATIQSHLAHGEVLVEFAVLEEESFALVATGKSARMVRLGPTAELDPAKAVKALALGDATRVLISPDGPLYEVPFVTLLGARDVTYVPSGTTYALLQSEAAARGEGVLALGAPDYKGRKLAPLPATRAEAEAVGTDLLLAGRATEQEFWRVVPRRKRWRAIHFACHGLVDEKAPLQSALAVTGGLLTGFEIVRGKIPADLVALSACETGRGRLYRGEGLVGLTNAFLFAGSPRVVVSLWKVDDEATRALMVKFYELWKKHPAAHALRLAQAHVAKQAKWKDPRYWAAWQLWGVGA